MLKPPAQLTSQHGFTLIELVIIIVILGILAAVAVPKFTGLTESSKFTATKQELRNLKLAIVGDPSVVAGGEFVSRGYEGDVGFPPSLLVDLVVKPDSVSSYNKLTRLGWNGPYIEGSDNSYLTDAWGNSYRYTSGSRTMISDGDGIDSLIETF